MDSFFSSLSPPCYLGTLKCHVGRMIHVSSFIHSWHVEVLGLQVRLTARLWRLSGRSPCPSLLLVTDPSSQPGYSSYPDGGLFLHWSRGRMAKSITGQGMYTLIPSVSLSVLTWLCTREFQAPSVFLGFDSIPADPAGQVLSASCSAKSVSGAIYLVLLTFLVAFLSYGFLLVLAGLFLLLKTCLHSPSSRGNRHGWYSVSILTGSSMCLLS